MAIHYMTGTKDVKEGDVVILRDFHKNTHKRTNVSRVTKAGWFYTADSGKVLFKPDGDCREKHGYRGKSYECVANTDENWAYLEDLARRDAENRAERKAAEEERLRKIAERTAAELAEVKAACNGVLDVVATYNAPDGTTVYMISLPVREEVKDRKAGWEIITVRMGPAKKRDYYYGKEAESLYREYAMTYTNGESRSFASISTESVKDSPTAEMDALWNCARYAYCAW